MFDKFEWQRGYGAFTHSRSQPDAVVKYILSRQEHHRKKTFKEAYPDLLDKYGVAYEKEYLFDFFDQE